MVDVGRVGVWSSALRVGDEGEAREAAGELEELGFGALWLPGRGPDVFERARVLLDATSRVAVATGIVSVWSKTAAEVAEAHAQLRAAHPQRFLLGLGISHAPLVAEYRAPLRVMREYLDELDGEPAVPQSERVLAALAPRMLELARDRSAGSHPYLVNVEHTHAARQVLGPEALLAPELGVVLETDPLRARTIARKHLETYTRLPNYVRNWLRHGLREEDVAGEPSDRLVDGLIAWGDLDAVAARIAAHHDAGADHVALQVLADQTQAFHREAWRELAALLRKSSPSPWDGTRERD